MLTWGFVYLCICRKGGLQTKKVIQRACCKKEGYTKGVLQKGVIQMGGSIEVVL